MFKMDYLNQKATPYIALCKPTSMGLLQAPQMGMPILSWQRRQYSSLSSCAV